MPLPPLPEENTKRYWIVYTVGGTQHHMMMRVSNSVDDATAVDELEAAWTLLLPALYNDTIMVGVEVAEDGSNVRNPLAIDDPIPGTGGGTITVVQKPREWTLSGRATDGRKSRVSIFGVNLNTPDNWKQEPLTTEAFVDFRSRLNAATGLWLTISGSKPSYHNRMTVTYNDHWQEEARDS